MATEAEKVKPKVMGLLTGKSILDIGCGSKKVVPWAVSADRHDPSADLKVDVDAASHALWALMAGKLFDVVFSSHCLEHMPSPIATTLKYWLSFVRPSGNLILYLPNEEQYVYNRNNPKQRNPEHVHYLTPKAFVWYLEQLESVIIDRFEEDKYSEDHYSFLVVVRKII